MSALLAAASVAVLLPMLSVALYNLATAARLERTRPPRRSPRVSLLVPARDEADNLREALPRLLRQRYPDLELLVLDDESRDDTAGVVRAFARSDPRLRLLRGEPLPAGWLGKNWACHQLAAAATGEVLVFCDADVRAVPEAVGRTVALLQEEDASAVTALPRHRFRGWRERAVVPLVAQLPVLALLPLRLVGRTRAPALSMANGQWLAFSGEAYRRCGGHAGVRGAVVEDVALGRRVKAAGDRLVPALAARTLEVWMYPGPAEMREGFRKNLFALLGGRPLPFAAGVALFLLAGVYPWLAPLTGGGWLPLALLLGLRAVGALLFGHGCRSVALHPAGALLLLRIALESAGGHRRGTLEWKGRPLPGPATGAAGAIGP